MEEEDLSGLSYRQLQQRAKCAGIKANLKREQLVEQLRRHASLEQGEGPSAAKRPRNMVEEVLRDSDRGGQPAGGQWATLLEPVVPTPVTMMAERDEIDEDGEKEDVVKEADAGAAIRSPRGLKLRQQGKGIDFDAFHHETKKQLHMHHE